MRGKLDASNDDIQGLARPAVSCRRLAERHTRMVVCTTIRHVRDRFLKTPRQISMN